MTSDRQPRQDADEAFGSAERTVRLYRTAVLALAILVIAIALWPKQKSPIPCGATVELAYAEPLPTARPLPELIDDVQRETLAPAALRETIDLAWNQWSVMHRSAESLDREAWSAWLVQALEFRKLDDPIGNYVAVEVRADGHGDPFIAHLVNRAALDFASRLERRLLQEKLQDRWLREQARLEDSLNRRRRWFEQFERTIDRQSDGLRVFTASAALSNGTSASSSSGTSVATSPGIETPLPTRVELILVELQMRQEQLETLARTNGWTASHPEYRNLAAQVDTLRSEATRELVAAGRRPSDYPLVAIGATEQVNEFYNARNRTESPAPQVETDAAIEQLSSTQQALDALRGEAQGLISDEAQLDDELTSWFSGSGTDEAQVRVVELAVEPGPSGAAIRSGHWLLMSLLAAGLGLAYGWNLNRQPDRFFSTGDVSEALDLPVLGIVPGDTTPPRGFWVSLKRNERRIQWLSEAILVGTVLLVGLGLLVEPRLFQLLVDHPLDGLARVFQVILGR